MLTYEHVEVSGWGAAIRGARNPMNSWHRMDSHYNELDQFILGPNDYDLCKRLIKAGSDHRKFLRMLHVQFDIVAPMSLYKELDTYKVATVRNSCSTMHKIHAKEFELEDFSYQKLKPRAVETLKSTISALNYWRDRFNETKEKSDWEQMIELLPSSYNQRSTMDMNYETLRNIYHARKNHKMTEWHTFCDMIRNLPYSEFITDEWKEEEHETN